MDSPGPITSPEYPQAVAASRQVVHIVAPKCYKVNVTFNDFQIRKFDSRCSYDVVEIRPNTEFTSGTR